MDEENDSLERIGEIIEKIEDSFNKGNFGELANLLTELITEIEKILPEILPVIDNLLEEFGSGVAKPIIDEIAKEVIKTTNCLNRKTTEYYQETLESAMKYEKAKATHLFAKFEALQNARFSKTDAMKILLAKMATEDQKSITERIIKIIDSVRETRKTETPISKEPDSFASLQRKFF